MDRYYNYQFYFEVTMLALGGFAILCYAVYAAFMIVRDLIGKPKKE
ncbi:MAG TPA: hypothetical protein VMS08_02995 [Candidatus Saccharimonadia bacterium]|nr:hypothetical protein [Candidatus Saccharimonadia bacterium]